MRMVRSALLALSMLAAGTVPGAADPVPVSGEASLPVQDIDRAVTWYRAMLGFIRIEDRLEGGVRVVTLARRFDAIELRSAEDATGSLKTSREPVTLIVKNVDTLVDRMAESDALIEREPRDDENGVYRVAVVRDPDGHALELREPLDDRPRTRRSKRL
ncbi:VOC family protein [Microvirga massiliensis]|uniref:VOC family protein n=1 Tax=Microvirga massiliensis TaxID=1033741 RepID=UPI00065FEE1F|nr:VOC family protein [Microvirga massiliensis]